MKTYTPSSLLGGGNFLRPPSWVAVSLPNARGSAAIEIWGIPLRGKAATQLRNKPLGTTSVPSLSYKINLVNSKDSSGTRSKTQISLKMESFRNCELRFSF